MNVDEWAESVGRLASLNKPNREVVASAVTGWLGTDIASYTEGRWEAVCRRTSWLFPDGWCFSVGTGFKPVFTHLSEELKSDSAFPMPKYFNSKEWKFFPHINGWCWVDCETDVPSGAKIVEFLDVFTLKHGKPYVGMPWLETFGFYVVEQESDYFEWYEGELENGEANLHKVMFDLATIVTDVELFKSKSHWGVAEGDETLGLSYFSDFMRFDRFVGKLDENNVLFLDLDQHCAGCSHGFEEWALKDNPALEGKPTFRTWGQNSDGAWFGDGTIAWVEAHNIWDATVEKRVKFYAEEEGLYTGVYENDWEPSECFEFSSPAGTLKD